MIDRQESVKSKNIMKVEIEARLKEMHKWTA
jgi:hypothetical protein